VNADEQVRALKGPDRPVHALAHRLEVLGELMSVDYLVAFDEPTAHEIVQAVRPHVYVKGGDYRPEAINEYDLVRELGIDLRILAHRPGLSTTRTIEKLARK
jgi:rfaE bifunctional protein nucleotidyltransferase chain/domain